MHILRSGVKKGEGNRNALQKFAIRDSALPFRVNSGGQQVYVVFRGARIFRDI